MPSNRPNPAVISSGRMSPERAAAATTLWTIQFDVPMHQGMQTGARLFEFYAGMDIQLTRSPEPDAIRVVATGSGPELARLIDWCDELFKGWHVDLRQAFSGSEFLGNDGLGLG